MGKQYKDDFLEAYLVLQAMHDTIMKGETFSQELKARAENAINNLGNWRIPNEEHQNKRADLVVTILEQLECNEKLEQKKEELLKDYMRAVITPTA